MADMSGRSFTAYAGLRPNQGSALGLSPGDRADLVTINAPGGARFTVARKIAPQFNAFLQELTAGGYNLNPKASGGYNNRTIAGSPRLSQHAFGNAIDLNWDVNPRGSAKHNLPENVGDIASKYGLVWGGTFSNPDPMHFEAGRIVDGLPAYSAPPETHLAANAKREVARMPNTAPQAMPVAGTTGTMAGLPDFGTLPSARKRKMAEALMTGYRDQLARTTNPLGALSAAVQAGVGTYLGDQYDTEEKTYKRKLAEALMGAKTDDDLQRTLYASGDDDLVKAAVSQRMAAAKPKNPIQVGDELVQQQSDGTFKNVYTGPGTDSIIEIFDEQGRPQKAVVNSRNPSQYKVLGGPKAAKSEITAADRKEIFEADEGAQASSNVQGALKEAIELNKKAYTGLLPQTRGWLGSQFGMENAEATQNLQNLVLTQVLDSLKATFGAAPTEGERQILVEVQGSVDKAPKVREEIFNRASVAAAKRQQFNMQKAKGLRSGTYYSPDFNPLVEDAAGPPPGDVPAPGANQPPSGGPARGGVLTPPPAAPRTPSEGAVNALLADTSPEAVAEFDEWFNGGKPGLAQRIIESRKTAPAMPQEVQQQPGYAGGLY